MLKDILSMDREQLRAEWDRLFNYKKTLTDYTIKKDVDRQLKRIERVIESLTRDPDKIVLNAEKYAIRVESILEQQSLFIGITIFGTPIGEGCYWNRGGHI